MFTFCMTVNMHPNKDNNMVQLFIPFQHGWPTLKGVWSTQLMWQQRPLTVMTTCGSPVFKFDMDFYLCAFRRCDLFMRAFYRWGSRLATKVTLVFFSKNPCKKKKKTTLETQSSTFQEWNRSGVVIKKKGEKCKFSKTCFEITEKGKKTILQLWLMKFLLLFRKNENSSQAKSSKRVTLSCRWNSLLKMYYL